MKRHLVWYAATLTVWMTGSLLAQESGDSLDSRLKFPIRLTKEPLSAAVGYLGTQLDGDIVLFGIEVETVYGEQPKVTVQLESGRTLRDALLQVTRDAPEYSFESAGLHFVNVYPTKGRQNKDNLMNMEIRPNRLTGIWTEELLSNPNRYLPDLRKAIAKRNGAADTAVVGGLSSDGRNKALAGHDRPPNDLPMKGGTLRSVLNQVALLSIREAEDGTGAAFGWICLHETSGGRSDGRYTWVIQDIWNPAERNLGGRVNSPVR